MTRGSCQFTSANGADAAFPPAPTIWVTDFAWMGRYVSSPDSNPKNLTVGEVDKIAAADGGIAYFVEQSELTVVGGDAGNRALARQAVKLAEKFGLPPGCPFWYAVDINPSGRFDPIAHAFDIYRDETPDQWPIGGYVGSQCGDFLLGRGLIDYLHLPAATSWWGGYQSPNAHIRQFPSQPYAGTRIDRNTVLQPVPMWFPGRDPVPPLEPEEGTDMPLDANDKAWIQQTVFNVVLGLWREQEIHNYLTMHTQADLNQIAQAVVAALPSASAGNCASPADVEAAVREVFQEAELSIDFRVPGA